MPSGTSFLAGAFMAALMAWAKLIFDDRSAAVTAAAQAAPTEDSTASNGSTSVSYDSTGVSYDAALDEVYLGRLTRRRCSVAWREPSLSEADDLARVLQDAAAPHRATVVDAGAEQDAARLFGAATVSRRRAAALLLTAQAGSEGVAILLSRLADALEVDAAAHLGQHDEQRDMARRYDELIATAAADARWSPSLARTAASVVRTAVARSSMRAADPRARLLALLRWIDEDVHEVPFCAPGTDPELAMQARMLADEATGAPSTARATTREQRQRQRRWLDDAHAVAAALAAAARTLPSDDGRLARFDANARRAAVLLVEDVGGLKTGVDEADYGRAATLLAPIEAELSADEAEAAAWEAQPDFVLRAGGAALKVASRARVQLLLAVALERAGRRAEAEALHARSGAARGEGGRVSSLHHGDTRNHLRETRRPLRALPFWRRAALPADTRAALDALEAGWRAIAAEGLRALGAGALLRAEENLASASRNWLQLDLRRRGEAVEEGCALVPTACSLLASHSAVLSPMGQAKLSAVVAGARIYPHAGPTNGRLRLHLGLHVPEEGYEITVGGETASWAAGEVLLLDDSFVHEVVTPPASGAPSMRLVLIVDLHHPDLLEGERARVPAFGHSRKFRQVDNDS